MSRGQEGEEKRVGGKRPDLGKGLRREAWGWLRVEITMGTGWDWESTGGLPKPGSREMAERSVPVGATCSEDLGVPDFSQALQEGKG